MEKSTFHFRTTIIQFISNIRWENTAPGTEFARDFCAGIGPLQLGVVLVFVTFEFRLSNHRFPSETGSWYNIPPDQRTCPICPIQQGNEFHYLFICPSTSQMREQYIHQFYTNRPDMNKMVTLFNSTHKNTLYKLSTFIQQIFKLF